MKKSTRYLFAENLLNEETQKKNTNKHTNTKEKHVLMFLLSYTKQ